MTSESEKRRLQKMIGALGKVAYVNGKWLLRYSDGYIVPLGTTFESAKAQLLIILNDKH